MAPVDPPLPSIDRPSVSRPAALLAGPLAHTCDLSSYRLAGTDFTDAEADPDPLILNGATWSQAKLAAARLSADLQSHLGELRRRRQTHTE